MWLASKESRVEASPASWADWERRHATGLYRLSLALIAFGVIWRIARYLLAMPIWGDEAMLLINYQTRDYADVFGPIEYCQIAPLLFHWAEMAALKLLGPSELAVRLPALVASLTGLGLFCVLSRLTLSPLPRTIAIGILSVAIWPATTGSLVKPYAWDLLFSVALLLPFAVWRTNRRRCWPLVLLCALAPIAMTASYPSVFVAGAVGATMIPGVVAHRDRRQILLLALFHALVVSTFVLHYEFVGRPHLESVTFGVSTADGMADFWKNAFPPADLLRLLVWLPSTIAGEIVAYPIGSQRGGSVLTLIVCMFGVCALRRRSADLLVAMLGVLALWFVAAAWHKYPIGSCRLGQHAAPIFCLLAGSGAAEMLRRFASADRASMRVGAVVSLLFLIGAGGMARDIFHPYRDREARDARAALRDLFGAADGPILVAQPRSEMRSATVHYYLGAKPGRVHWVDSPDWSDAVRDAPILWVVVCSQPPVGDEVAVISRQLRVTGRDWKCVNQCWADVTGKGPPATPTFRAYRFVRSR